MPAAEAAVYQRSRGEAAVAAGPAGLVRAGASGSAKLRFPRAAPGTVDALVINTSGGLTAGDTFAVNADAGEGRLIVSTPACERVYRCEGGLAEVHNTVSVGPGGHALVLPQPTILFEGSALNRRTDAAVEAGGRLTLCEGLVLGRAAMAEDLSSVWCDDRITLMRGKETVLVDALRLRPSVVAGDSAALLAGHRAIGLVMHWDGDAPAAVDRARVAIDQMAGVLAGASAVNGVAVARCLAPSHTALQDALAALVQAMSGAEPPRAWAL